MLRAIDLPKLRVMGVVLTSWSSLGFEAKLAAWLFTAKKKKTHLPILSPRSRWAGVRSL